MMRMILEIAMVMAVGLGMVMVMKVTSKENEANETLSSDENGDDDNKDSGSV